MVTGHQRTKQTGGIRRDGQGYHAQAWSFVEAAGQVADFFGGGGPPGLDAHPVDPPEVGSAQSAPFFAVAEDRLDPGFAPPQAALGLGGGQVAHHSFPHALVVCPKQSPGVGGRAAAFLQWTTSALLRTRAVDHPAGDGAHVRGANTRQELPGRAGEAIGSRIVGELLDRDVAPLSCCGLN